MEIATLHKLLGKYFIKALLLGLLPAYQPFYTNAELQFEQALVGTFGPERPGEPIVSDAERETLSISRSKNDPKLYTIILSGAEERIEFEARLFQLHAESAGGAYFLDLSPTKGNKRQFVALMRHLAVNIDWNSDRLTFRWATDDRIRAAAADTASKFENAPESNCGAETEAYYTAGERCTRVLTAPTKALQAVLHEILRKGLNESVSLYRIPVKVH